MINLYQWGSDGKLPNAGFFCMKLESYLKLQKINHTVHSVSSVGKSPKKTMPFIEIDGIYTSDSQLIIEQLEEKQSIPLNLHLSEVQKLESHVYQMMLEKQLIPSVIYFRWFPDLGWNQFSRKIFYGAPTIIRILIGGMLRKQQIKSLYSNGVSRHSSKEIIGFAEKDLASISNLLGNKNFFYNDKPCLLDIVTYTVICNILMASVDMPLIDLTKKYSNLVSHAERMLWLIYNRKIN